ncbi:MAG TPA: aspartate/glutamate racemase family protein [Mycobacteriales bacterium]|nr:aspartate/glutamate racemase family protein [Mycobacteriales bacterium]
MTNSVALLHTAPLLTQVFGDALRSQAPKLEAYHLVDESLLQDTMKYGMLPRTRRKMVGYLASAEDSGAAAVLVTCSSLGEAVEECRPMVSIPVVRVDEEMAREAVRAGDRIGVVATVDSTLGPTRAIIERVAAEAGLDRQITALVCSGAFEALRAGDTATHDARVAAEVRRLAESVDVLVLAQASMARVVGEIPDLGVPALTSPESAVRALAAAVRS